MEIVVTCTLLCYELFSSCTYTSIVCPFSNFTFSCVVAGISRFDLVGMFGNLHWLSNWYLLAMYHLLFFVTIIYLWTRRVTRSVVSKVGQFFNLVAHKKVSFQSYPSSSSALHGSSFSSSPDSSLSSSGLFKDAATTPVQDGVSDDYMLLASPDVPQASTTSNSNDSSHSNIEGNAINSTSDVSESAAAPSLLAEKLVKDEKVVLG